MISILQRSKGIDFLWLYTIVQLLTSSRRVALESNKRNFHALVENVTISTVVWKIILVRIKTIVITVATRIQDWYIYPALLDQLQIFLFVPRSPAGINFRDHHRL